MNLEERMSRLERRCNRLMIACTLLVALLLALGFLHIDAERTTDGILHVHGLVVEDAQGRGRILLGAPFPDVPNRMRHDAGTMAMLFLDEQGHDRLTIGQALPPQIQGRVPENFHRIGEAVGVFLHNTVGDERGGMSWLSNGRGAISFDYPDRDAIGMYVDDKSRSATFVLEYADEAIGDVSFFEMTAKGQGGRFSLFDPKGQTKTQWTVDRGIVLPGRP
ncbi:hypothetical protein [Luteibacter yeojuensis]|uniref:Uncharacterized protein n=1 Tax=Luteibacter yeojuensis TaxID=345309 RepID=A0A7X5QSI4_9GAMM|nr:hypothetical protein [Luteibacter yeojuensis]NID14505.1 hypothetical protein [Luteibacter yeojuensis]